MNNEPAPLLSRAADAVYWMGRYIERAENVARFIDVNLHLQLDLALEPAHRWQPLLDTSGDAAVFRELHGEADKDKVIDFLVWDTNYLNSICTCLRAARENARSVREIISSEMWEQVNGMYLNIQAQRAQQDSDRLAHLLRSIRLGCHMFEGITDATMSYNEAWQFLRLGRRLERADKTSRILDVKYFMLLPSVNVIGTPYDDIHWAAVLKSVSGFEMYRKKHGRITPRSIVDFLVLDREFPRAIRHCLRAADECLHAITGTPMGSCVYPSERAMAPLRAELDYTSVENIIGEGLHEYLDGLQARMNTIDDSLMRDFFASVATGHASLASVNS
ncbi:MAG TPA: alpha-E domain-containing protein [Terriglobia bacterium]|nr:alpha-E domain-containing protein [Terriglobia bacterium]